MANGEPSEFLTGPECATFVEAALAFELETCFMKQPEDENFRTKSGGLNENLTWGIVWLIAGLVGQNFMKGSSIPWLLIFLGTAMAIWGGFQQFVLEQHLSPRIPKKLRKPTKTSGPAKKKDGTRETMESVVVAFILAFLFRTFEAEAFVIPTGSMAPTLYGRHKDIECAHCKFKFAVGASEEVGAASDGAPQFPGAGGDLIQAHPLTGRLSLLEYARCPNCRFTNRIRNAAVFKGDRILVNKQPTSPERFDVTVFKYPEEPNINYIKRLVGLPNETLRIRGGDLFARKNETDPWEILRKDDPNKQRVLQIPVYDDRFPPRRLLAAGFPERWSPVTQADTDASIAGWEVIPDESPDGWTAERATRTFSIDADIDELKWLRYRHIPPTQSDWATYESTGELGSESIGAAPQLIADYCGYNTVTSSTPRAEDYGTYWVGDLTTAFELNVENATPDGELLIELVEGEKWYRCRILPASGHAVLSQVDLKFDRDGREEDPLAKVQIPIQGDGTWEIEFANVDDRLCLWIDGKVVDFGEPGEVFTPHPNRPQQGDLTPVGLAVRGLKATIGDLRILRDIYYRAERTDDETGVSISELGGGRNMHESELRKRLSSPESWADYYFEHQQSATFELHDDEFLMLGDNSPRSKDSRLFDQDKRARRGDMRYQRFAVPRTALIGKAFFIYWPHGIPFMNDGQGYVLNYHYDTRGRETTYPKYRVPFYPQVGRMRRIR